MLLSYVVRFGLVYWLKRYSPLKREFVYWSIVRALPERALVLTAKKAQLSEAVVFRKEEAVRLDIGPLVLHKLVHRAGFVSSTDGKMVEFVELLLRCLILGQHLWSYCLVEL